jgi:subtilisin family serine protease
MDPKNASSRAVRARLGGTFVPLAALTMMASCSQAHDARETEGASSQAIVSNREQTDKTFTAIVRLSSPPLLQGARDATGHVRIDPFAKALLLGEQKLFLDALHALSPDIQVLFTYRLTFNGFAIVGPTALKEKFAGLPGVVSLEQEQTFERPIPEVAATAAAATPGPFDTNSVKFIGGDDAHAAGITGKGTVVGVIDTGVDYTHAMFGGAGTAAAYAANDPNVVEDGSFPTAKVIGGVDLVGTAYDASSIDETIRLPKPDADPLDEAGHGSHVSGTIAGHGNGTDTYDGVAPDAKIFAIKIFGKSGSVGDSVIMAALEKAADPNGDLDTKDRLDVVNLSLGGNFGTRYALYEEVIGNLTWGGTATICAAGNAGPTPYVVSAPSTAPDAISVAASIDDASWNWQFAAVSFKTAANPDLLVQAYEAVFSKPIASAVGVGGKLVPAGLAITDYSPADAALIAGNVALIDRGAVAFYDKVRRAAAAGAVGVVVVNNAPGAPIVMGGGTGVQLPIPAIMVSLDMGKSFKADIAAGNEVDIAFHTDKRIETPEVVDSLASFSSRGPRSLDGMIKPEVSAPGYQVVSAAMGTGSQGVKFSGTSMATPHVTGVVALMRQALPAISTDDIKARLMATTSPVHDTTAALAPLPVSQQGAGRVNIMGAIGAPLFADPPSLSLGFVSASEPASVSRVVWLQNPGRTWVRATVTADAKPGLAVNTPKSDVWVPPYGSAPVAVRFDVDLSKTSTAFVTELDDVIRVAVHGRGDQVTSLVVPALLEARRGAEVAVDTSSASSGAIALSLTNPGPFDGEVLPFNLVGLQKRDPSKKVGPCSLASAGYRVNGTTLEVGVRLAHPLSGWNLCEVSMLVDADGDGVPEQELAGTSDTTLKPASWPYAYGSYLIDAPKMRAVEAKMELGTATPADTYLSAVLDAKAFSQFGVSQVGVIAADLTKLKTGTDGKLHVKIGLLPQVEGTVGDDFLGAGPDGEWLTIDPASAPFGALPSTVAVASAGTASLAVTSPAASGALLLFMPDNDPRVGSSALVGPSGAVFVVR